MPKILVPVKRVPDYAVKVKLSADQTAVQTDGIKWIINPFDEIAVEEALRIREKNPGTEVVVVSIGPEATGEQLRTALAMGADRAILVKTEGYVDSDAASKMLEAVFRRDQYNLVIMGKQAIDSDANQTGQLLASRLGLPQATFASKLVLGEGFANASVTREVDGGLETIKITLPGIVTTDLRLNEPRYASLVGIVQAKKKPLETLTPADLGVTAEPLVRVLKLQLPPARKGGSKVGSVQELVQKLQSEAKVI